MTDRIDNTCYIRIWAVGPAQVAFWITIAKSHSCSPILFI